MSSVAAVVTLAGFAWLTFFQLLPAAGRPLGRLARGGARRVLPRSLRRAFLASAGLALIAALRRREWRGRGRRSSCDRSSSPSRPSPRSASSATRRSRIERLHEVRLTILIAGSSAALALG
ncbi:MAG: hypothetical protein ACOCYW_06780 [Roseicyclus sp.]